MDDVPTCIDHIGYFVGRLVGPDETRLVKIQRVNWRGGYTKGWRRMQAQRERAEREED